MSRILIRAGKEPWVPITPETTLAGNVLGTNSGNAVFSTAVFSALAADGVTLEADYFQVERIRSAPHIAGLLDDRYDRFVLPFANAFRPPFLPYLARWTKVIRSLTKPVTIAGIGGQFEAGTSDAISPKVADATDEFMRAVLDRAPSVGVRGERTAEFLKALGYGDEHVRVIGCPSMYRADRAVSVRKRTPTLEPGARVALSATPRMKERGDAVPNMARIIAEATEMYPDSFYVPQDNQDLAMLLWGAAPGGPRYDGFPVTAEHPLISLNRTRFYVDPRPWFDDLSGVDFLVGSRIHGAIAALVAGTPACVLAFDSRTQELSEYHAIPHRLLPELSRNISIADLYDEFDEGRFMRVQAENRVRYIDFLDEHGITHILDDDVATDAYRAKMSTARLAEPVDARFVLDTSPTERERLAWLRSGLGDSAAQQELQSKIPSWVATAKSPAPAARRPSAPATPAAGAPAKRQNRSFARRLRSAARALLG